MTTVRENALGNAENKKTGMNDKNNKNKDKDKDLRINLAQVSCI